MNVLKAFHHTIRQLEHVSNVSSAVVGPNGSFGMQGTRRLIEVGRLPNAIAEAQHGVEQLRNVRFAGPHAGVIKTYLRDASLELGGASRETDGIIDRAVRAESVRADRLVLTGIADASLAARDALLASRTLMLRG